jgi:hypothetical protein
LSLKNVFLTRSVSIKMNTQQIQFNRQSVAALLLAGLILALAAGLAWAGAEASGSATPPAQMAQGCPYSPQPGQTEPSAASVVCPRADFSGDESELLPWSQFRSIKGAKKGIAPGNLG